MVSNEEIKQKLGEKKETHTNEYLICDTCQGSYELQTGEKPEDFSMECECGGNLTYSKNISTPDRSGDTKIKKIALLGFGFFIIFMILAIFTLPILYIGYVESQNTIPNVDSGSAYNQLAGLKSNYNNLNVEYNNLNRSVDNLNDQNLKSTYMDVNLQLVKTRASIYDVESALSTGKSNDIVQNRIITAQKQLNTTKDSLESVKKLL